MTAASKSLHLTPGHGILRSVPRKRQTGERILMSKRLGVLVIVSSACLGIGYGQQKGQYPLGTNGLGAGIQPAPGFTYSNEAIFYTADRLKGPNGVAIPVQGSYDLDLDQNMFIYTSKYKFLGGTYGAMFDLFISNGSLIAPQIGLTAGGAGITDTYVQPLTLGYHFSRVDLSAAFGMVVPTGRYTRDPQSTQNIGSGYFGYMPSVGSTIYLTKDKRTIVSTIFLYEFHGEKRYTDITPGQTFDMEWAIGRSLPVGKKMFNSAPWGMANGRQQTTADRRPTSRTPVTLWPQSARRSASSSPSGIRASTSGTSPSSALPTGWKEPRSLLGEVSAFRWLNDLTISPQRPSQL